MDYQETLDWLFAQLPMFQRVGAMAFKKDLGNTEKLMELLGHPERGFKSIHIAGTNGKGSVASMLAAVFQTAGYKTGLYTSPHLKDFRERIRINGDMIPEKNVISFVKKSKEDFIKIGLSFFEMTVGMAFDYFDKENVDIAIVETGMGGRLDSTNVLQPELSIITNISLDHTQFLGGTVEEIAIEKAGIIKEKTPILIGERRMETQPVFEQISKEKNAPIFYADEFKMEGLRTDLEGLYQRENLRTAVAAISLLDPVSLLNAKLTTDNWQLRTHLKEGLLNVKKLTGLRGRWEILGQNPLIIADTAHNIAGVEEVLTQIKKLSFRQLHIVWGMVSDKNISAILRMLPKSAFYYFCKPDLPRGKEAEELKREAVQFGLSGKSYSSVNKAFEEVKSHTLSDDLIFVGGSTFVVAEVL